jgi:2-oxoglutarate ferredoxin oxidoreductase subunit beta
MSSLLNTARPPAFCPGCAHDRIAKVLDMCFGNMGLKGNQIAIISDIGCGGLFDTFFHTHAFHGLHGRALTYATGLKLARPELEVVVIMGDGGLGIGGAHLLGACRRNLSLTLIILDNFNFGMTGGQYSSTTPPEAQVGSGFLNSLERPLDVCQVAASAGAPFVIRRSGMDKNLAEDMEKAIRFDGFSVMDIWGICPGRYQKKNKLTPRGIDEALANLPPADGPVKENRRKEYGQAYRETASRQKASPEPLGIGKLFDPPEPGRREVVILGSAGQRIITAGEILCLAGLTAGLKATQKNEYDITVLRGASNAEVILSSEEIGFTGIERPSVIAALGQDGVGRRRQLFESLGHNTLVLQADGVEIHDTDATVRRVDFRGQGIKSPDWALASISLLAKLDKVISPEMLRSALETRFKGQSLDSSLELLDRVEMNNPT